MRIAWKPLGWGLLAVLVVSIPAAILAARHLWSNLLQENGIEALEWQELGLSFSGVSVGELKLVQSVPERDLALQGRDLSLNWRWPEWGSGWQPELTILKAGHLKLDLYTKSAMPSETKPEKSQQGQWQAAWLAWLPSEISVQQFEAKLPCESGRCPLSGSLKITSTQSGRVSEANSSALAFATASGRLPVTAKVQLAHEGHQLDVLAILDNSGLDTLNFTANVSIDEKRYLSVSSDYIAPAANGLASWQGSVEVPDLPRADWLLAWLHTWQSLPLEQWPDQPDTGSATVNWKLQGPEGKRFLAAATGAVEVHALLPQPWPAPGVGSISGKAEVSLKADKGVWQPETLLADLKLSHPAPWVKKVPEQLRPELLELSVRPAKAVASTSPAPPSSETGSERGRLPLQVEVTSWGGANLAISSHLAVSTGAPWWVQLGSTQLTATLPELQVADWRLTRPRLEASLTGWLDTSAAALKFGKTALLQTDTLEPLPGGSALAGALIKGVSVDFSGATLNAEYSAEKGGMDRLALAGPLGIKAKQIRHPQVQPQPWQFNGGLSANMDRTDVEGVLKAKTGTSMNLDLKFPYQGLLSLEANMRVSGESEAEALSRIFTQWPEVLLISGGNVSANAIYEQPQNGTKRLAGKLVFADWSGTYDRTAWSRMNGSAEFLLKNERIRVATPELTIEEVNPGLPVGPVRLAGRYEAPLGQLAAGLLTLEQANSNALGGEIKIHPGSWDLAQAPVQVPVELNQLSLARLLQLYPTEGLAGTGILSGTVPMLFDPATGIRVERGRIDALEPGGRLQLTAERLKALARQSESMKLVAKALEDFRYSVLDSGIDYDKDGTLILTLHLQGNSPGVGNGQPVVLNINLEENIPALLRSLQLSGRVSEAVTERVKNLLKKRERDSDDDLIE
ncbi:intermembrane phospholipid transport protein YdbH family protein [Marinobacter salexigens]|uniref:intermembrane phospholipid transport protein YdbH family protein n=1 Tax=Marinobacter salexigens TaxID=1925763 RepID=UPI000C291936|nr:YdbH domain-containing protein [Marinobacter salexigens]